MNTIDTTFDVRTDAGGKDPDTHSATLRRYHRLLWSKPLPGGQPFELTERGAYLHHASPRGEFWLSSDSIVQTFLRWRSMHEVTSQLSQAENDAFMAIASTVGATTVFPANRVGRKQTINGARGFSRAIADRFDLTLECIRRHYVGRSSPLDQALSRYADFFALFEDFSGYVDFFLLWDLVTTDGLSVRFFMPCNDFEPPAVPRDVDTYRAFRRRSIAFIVARNARIAATPVYPARAAAAERAAHITRAIGP